MQNLLHRFVISFLFPLIFVFLLLFTPLPAHAGNQTESYFYPADTKPFGKSYPEWAATWFKFVFEYPVIDLG